MGDNLIIKGVLIEPLWNWNKIKARLLFVCNNVLIEPLWNWNHTLGNDVVNLLYVLIEPLWNWNDDKRQQGGGHRRLNRTFMELKLAQYEERLVVVCLNRTFMELKHVNYLAFSSDSFVLIEPLWNWNKSSSTHVGTLTPVLIEPLWNWNNFFRK